MRGKLENFSVKQVPMSDKWYVSDSSFRGVGPEGAYVHSDLEVYPGMGSHWHGGGGGFDYLPTQEEAEERLREFLLYQTYSVQFNPPYGWHIANQPGADKDRYVHADLEIHPSMKNAEGKLDYLETREEAEERLRLFNLKRKTQQEETTLLGGTKDPISFELKGTTSGRIQTQEPNFTESEHHFGSQTGWEDVTDDFSDPQNDPTGEEEGCGQPMRVEEVRQNRHTQLLLENEDVPTVTTIRARVVTDGERVVLEVQTPQYPWFQPVARLQVNKKGQVVMYPGRLSPG